MARINRTDVIQKAVNDLAISGTGEKIPTETLDKVQLTYSLNRQFSNLIFGNVASTSGVVTATAPTLGAGQDIYITHIEAAIVKDATCDLATSTLNLSITPDSMGISRSIAYINTITLTAQNQNISIDLAYPIKIKSAGTVTIGGTFTVGVCLRSIAVTGFTTSSN